MEDIWEHSKKRQKLANLPFEVEWNLPENQVARNIWAALLNNGVISAYQGPMSMAEVEQVDRKAVSIIRESIRMDRDSSRVLIKTGGDCSD